MKQNDHYSKLIDNYLSEKGIEDPDIRMELSDHFCELLDQDQIENEIIPSDILSRVDNHFERSQFHSVYKELSFIKRNSSRNFVDKILTRYSIGSGFILLIIHRVMFFGLLPMIPANTYAPFQPFAIGLTAAFYFGMASFFVLKALRIAKHR